MPVPKLHGRVFFIIQVIRQVHAGSFRGRSGTGTSSKPRGWWADGLMSRIESFRSSCWNMLNLKPHAILDFTQDISHVVTEGGVSGAGVSESVSWLVMLGSFLTYFETVHCPGIPMQFPYNSREGYSETTRVSNIAEGRLTTHECRIQFLLSACRGVPSKSQGGCSPRDELISCSDCSDISRTYWFILEHFRHHRHQGVPTLLRQGQTLMRSRRYWPQNQWVGGPTGNSQVGLERQWLKVLDTGSNW